MRRRPGPALEVATAAARMASLRVWTSLGTLSWLLWLVPCEELTSGMVFERAPLLMLMFCERGPEV